MRAGEEVMARKWEYRVTEPNLPSGATSPVMESQQMQEWLIAWTTTDGSL
jgi:hypothetical protein